MSFLKHLFPLWRRSAEDVTKANGAILSALDKELSDSEKDAIEDKTIMALDSSTGELLDSYGKLFGVLRRDAEDDNTYRNRTLEYIQLERGTIPAIKAAIRNFLQDYESNIEIYEPYTNVFTLNNSKLNGYDHLLGEYYRVAVIDIKIDRPFPTALVDVINDFKPAGVTVFLTAVTGNSNVVSSGVEDKDAAVNFTTVYSTNGLTDIIRGHLNLTSRSRTEDSSGLFTLNDSHLNSLDRLAGSLSASRGTYNLASFSESNLTFNAGTSISDVQQQTTALSDDFYTQTGKLTNSYAAQVVDGKNTSFLYFTLDVATYFSVNYSSYLLEVQPNGIYTKNTYASLMDEAYLQYYVKAATPINSPSSITLQVLNLSTGNWDSLSTKDVNYIVVGEIADIDSIVDYISDNGLIFTRMKINPNSSQDSYEFDLHFFELGFNKFIATRPTIQGTVLETEATTTMIENDMTYDGGTYTTESTDSVLDGGDYNTTPNRTVDGGEY